MVANGGTDAYAPQSSLVRWVLRGVVGSALFATVFSNIILNPIENVPFAQLRPQFSAFFAPFPNSKRTFCKIKF
jgi:hypothetical protein